MMVSKLVGRCCNYDYKPCYAEKDIFGCGVGWVRLMRNEGKKALEQHPVGRWCPYNEFSKFRVPDWCDDYDKKVTRRIRKV